MVSAACLLNLSMIEFGGSMRPTPETNLDINLSAMFGDIIDADQWMELCNS